MFILGFLFLHDRASASGGAQANRCSCRSLWGMCMTRWMRFPSCSSLPIITGLPVDWTHTGYPIASYLRQLTNAYVMGRIVWYCQSWLSWLHWLVPSLKCSPTASRSSDLEITKSAVFSFNGSNQGRSKMGRNRPIYQVVRLASWYIVPSLIITRSRYLQAPAWISFCSKNLQWKFAARNCGRISFSSKYIYLSLHPSPSTLLVCNYDSKTSTSPQSSL